MPRLLKVIVALSAVASIQCISISPSSAAVNTCAQGGVCVVGDTGPGGGKVFFVKSTGAFSKSRIEGDFMSSTTYRAALTSGEQTALSFDYLEVAPTQRTLGFWGTNGAVTGGTSELIGTGAANTTKVVSTFPSDNPTNNAAHYADQYINSGKSDWFLPSYQELLLIMILSLESDSGGPNIGTYSQGLWSSSSTDPTSGRYSARGQLSGYVTRGTNSGGVAAIRSFSLVAAESSSSSESGEAARKEAEKARAVQIATTRAEILKKLIRNEIIEVNDLVAAAIPLKRIESLQSAFEDEIKQSGKDPSDVMKFEKILFTGTAILKYAEIEKITGINSGIVYARNLVKYGVIPDSTPKKTWLIARLMEKQIEDRDSIAEIDAFVAASVAEYQARKERLSAILKKIQSRRN